MNLEKLWRFIALTIKIQPDGRKVKGTLHWVSANHYEDIEIRLYDRLFNVENPDKVEEGQDFTININKDSLKVITGKAEPALAEVEVLDKFQFERIGYFCVDKDSTKDKPIFNRTVALRDTWSKISNK